MSGSHHPFLVAVSITIGILASYTALQLAGRVSAATGRIRAAWLASGSVAMGVGIWSMHFVAMLALQLPVAVTYDVPLWLLSVVIAILASLLALVVVSRRHVGVPAMAAGGLLMGLAIAGMHYTGMAAVRIPGRITYDPWLVLLSIAIAIGCALVALVLARYFRYAQSGRAGWAMAGSGVVMGLAIAGLHYTAMAAARFTILPAAPMADQGMLLATPALTVSVVTGTLVILGLALLGSLLDRRLRVRDAEAAALRESRRAMATLLGNLPGMAYRCCYDSQRTLEFASDGALELTGYTADALVGNSSTAFGRLIRPADAELTWEQVQLAVGEGRRFHLTYRIRTATGAERWVSEQGQAIVSSDGEVLALEGFITDITERTLLEEKLRHAQKMEAVGRLAGGVAHDFNNLLTVITGNVALLLEDMPRGDSIRPDLEEIDKAAARAAALTRQLLAFGRKQMLQPKVLDLNAQIEHSGGMLRRLIPSSIAIQVQLDPALGKVKADPSQLDQVFLNLAVNARDAMPNGGVITIRSQNRTISDDDCWVNHFLQPGRYVSVSVSDTGCGMTPEIASRVFEPFFTTKKLGEGTGLGLAMVYGLVKQSGGYVLVETAPGRGSAFEILLPRKEEGELEVTPAPAPKLWGGKETVLVVEDEPQVRHFARRVLEQSGYKVLEAEDGEAALQVLADATIRIDLLLTDVMMPRMGGHALAEHLLATDPAIKVIFMSGYAGDALTEEGMLCPEAHFLQKPIAPHELTNVLRAALDVPGVAA